MREQGLCGSEVPLSPEVLPLGLIYKDHQPGELARLDHQYPGGGLVTQGRAANWRELETGAAPGPPSCLVRWHHEGEPGVCPGPRSRRHKGPQHQEGESGRCWVELAHCL